MPPFCAKSVGKNLDTSKGDSPNKENTTRRVGISRNYCRQFSDNSQVDFSQVRGGRGEGENNPNRLLPGDQEGDSRSTRIIFQDVSELYRNQDDEKLFQNFGIQGTMTIKVKFISTIIVLLYY